MGYGLEVSWYFKVGMFLIGLGYEVRCCTFFIWGGVIGCIYFAAYEGL